MVTNTWGPRNSINPRTSSRRPIVVSPQGADLRAAVEAKAGAEASGRFSQSPVFAGQSYLGRDRPRATRATLPPPRSCALIGRIRPLGDRMRDVIGKLTSAEALEIIERL